MKIGVLTGGGDCPGLNAVIRAVVHTAHRKYGWEVVGIEDGFEGLLKDGKTHLLESGHVRGVLVRGGTILGTTNRGNPFEYKIRENGRILQIDRSDEVIERFRELGLDALIVIGGDGSLKIALRLYEEKGIPLVGVPKTIDNDLRATDFTFGYQTAIVTATDAIDKLHTTAESHHRVMIVETMGRYVGWIALESGIAGGADVILIPEIPYRIEKVLEKIYWRNETGKKFSIIVIAEGAKPEGGVLTLKSDSSKELGAERLGGVGEILGKAISDESGMETRVTVLGHLQRGGIPSAFDRILSTRFGSAAVNLISEKKFGYMVCLKTPAIDSIPIRDAISDFKAVNPEGQLVTMAEDMGISFGR